ncbi:MAG: hypothetical protein KC503_39175 [Myxococcales bacterium]|nr:hypothetical protein [Myxococcales bacterium]
MAGVAAQQQGGESHYRDAGITRFIDAVDVMFVRREQLLRAATVATLALCMMLSVRLYLRDRTPLGALVARTAAQIRCPNGTERVTVGGPPQLFMHYCRDPAGNKHGPYGVWNHDGRLRERGAYRRGVRTGPLIEIDPPLFNRNSCAINGQRKKRGDKCPLIARVSRLDSKGRAHGMAYGYFYPRRQRAYIGTFRSGRRVGAWTYYHPRGHQLYRIDYGKRGTEYAYRDERNGNWCPGNAQPAIAWQLSKPDQRCTITCTTIPIKGLAFTERGICADRGTGPKLSQLLDPSMRNSLPDLGVY